MSIDRLPDKTDEPGNSFSVEVQKARLDLIILRAMAKKLALTLHTIGAKSETVLPLSYSFKEQRGRQHRIILFAPAALHVLEEMRFVGFVSQRSSNARPEVIEEIFRVDQLMLAEIARIPGLLSYSSLELHPGIWFNLVLFNEMSVKTQVRSGEVHRYAAHQLSPDYYAWIRLHNGTLTGALTRHELRLKSTRQYHFFGTQKPPFIHEKHYETSLDVS